MNAAHHSTFVIERELPSGPGHAFRFWSDPALKQRWNACHPDWTVLEDAFEFHVGGIEAYRWRTPEGHEQTFAARYFDIEPQRRIIYAFEMSFGGERQSVSLATVEFQPAGIGTRMLYTEQLAFLGSAEARRQRIAGTGSGFDRLVEVIASEAPQAARR